MDENYDIRWRSHPRDACEELSRFRREELFADVVLCVDDVVFKAHRVILAACSAYFERVFSRMGDAKFTPYVILRDTDPALFKFVLDFIYDGQVRVPCHQLTSFMALAQGLEIRGLAGQPAEINEIEAPEQPVAAASPSRAPSPPPYSFRKRKSSDKGSSDESKIVKMKKSIPKFPKGLTVMVNAGEIRNAFVSTQPGEDEEKAEEAVKTECDESVSDGDQVTETGDMEEVDDGVELSDAHCEPASEGADVCPLGDIPQNIPPEISTSGLVRLTPFILRGKGPDGLPVSFCAACGYMSPSAQNAIRHERIHTGERPFQCHLCHRKFSQSSNYRRHLIAIHSAVPPQ